MKLSPLTLPGSLPRADQRTLDRLWETLVGFGVINPNDATAPAEPRQTSQLLPCIEDTTEHYRAFLTESLFTGLFTGHRDIMLRCYVQAEGYAQRLRGIGYEPGSFVWDKLGELRRRVEDHLLYGKGAE